MKYAAFAFIAITGLLAFGGGLGLIRHLLGG
jgi:hypothetical protein